MQAGVCEGREGACVRSGARATGACVMRGARVRGGGGVCEEGSVCEGVRGKGVRRGVRVRGERAGRGAGGGGNPEPARGGVRERLRWPACAGRTGGRGRGEGRGSGGRGEVGRWAEQREGVC